MQDIWCMLREKEKPTMVEERGCGWTRVGVDGCGRGLWGKASDGCRKDVQCTLLLELKKPLSPRRQLSVGERAFHMQSQNTQVSMVAVANTCCCCSKYSCAHPLPCPLCTPTHSRTIPLYPHTATMVLVSILLMLCFCCVFCCAFALHPLPFYQKLQCPVFYVYVC